MSDTWSQLDASLRAVADLPPNERQGHARRLGTLMRSLIERVARDDLPTDALEALSAQVDAVLAELPGTIGDPSPHDGGHEAFAKFFENSPMVGLANPIAPPLRLMTSGDHIVGSVRFGAAYEGPPGHVHGGFIAAVFDQVLGMAQSYSGNPGMTGTLTVRYRQPTPLNADLAVEGRLERVEGRKIFTSARLLREGAVTAEAEGVFITVDFAAMQAVAEERPTEG